MSTVPASETCQQCVEKYTQQTKICVKPERRILYERSRQLRKCNKCMVYRIGWKTCLTCFSAKHCSAREFLDGHANKSHYRLSSCFNLNAGFIYKQRYCLPQYCKFSIMLAVAKHRCDQAVFIQCVSVLTNLLCRYFSSISTGR